VSIHAAKSSRDHARIVEHKQITMAQVLEEIAEPAMLNLTGVTMQNEQTRQISLGRGHLSNEFWPQLKVKIHSSHVARALSQCSCGARRQVQGEIKERGMCFFSRFSDAQAALGPSIDFDARRTFELNNRFSTNILRDSAQ